MKTKNPPPNSVKDFKIGLRQPDYSSSSSSARSTASARLKEKEASVKAALKEQGEYKKLYEKTLAESQEKDSKIKQGVINNKISLLAAQKGIRKAEYLKMFDISNLEVNDDLEVPGLEESFDKFFKNNPDLFGGESPSLNIDSGKPNLSNTTNLQAEHEQLMKAARFGDSIAIVKLREFRKQHGIKG